MGGIGSFSADSDAITKWTMGWADQAQNLNSLLQLCNIRDQNHDYRCIQPLQILKSESRKSNVVAVLENKYVNLFNIALNRTMLINLGSGSEMETHTMLLNLQQDGIIIASQFFTFL